MIFTEVIHQVAKRKDIEVGVVVVQYRDLNDEIHYRYDHVEIVLWNSIEQNHPNVASE